MERVVQLIPFHEPLSRKWKSAMPEGHTIHRIARDHQNWFAGQRLIVSSPQGRFKAEAAKISGKQLREVSAHGKHLFYHWNRNLLLHVHLGLYGKFRLHRNPPPEPRGAVRVRMIGGKRSFDLNGCMLVASVKNSRDLISTYQIQYNEFSDYNFTCQRCVDPVFGWPDMDGVNRPLSAV